VGVARGSDRRAGAHLRQRDADGGNEATFRARGGEASLCSAAACLASRSLACPGSREICSASYIGSGHGLSTPAARLGYRSRALHRPSRSSSSSSHPPSSPLVATAGARQCARSCSTPLHARLRARHQPAHEPSLVQRASLLAAQHLRHSLLLRAAPTVTVEPSALLSYTICCGRGDPSRALDARKGPVPTPGRCSSFSRPTRRQASSLAPLFSG